MNYYYYFKVKYYDEFENTHNVEEGIVFANTYADVAEKLMAHYGDSQIEQIKDISPMTDFSVLTFKNTNDSIKIKNLIKQDF